MTSAPTLQYARHLDLLDRYGRATSYALGELDPGVPVRPHGTPARAFAADHLATLAVWRWLVEHPESDWRAYDAPDPLVDHVGVLAAIEQERSRLLRLLVDVGPGLSLDFFGRSGTAADVARLLAHEVISAGRALGEALGTPMDPLPPEVAVDGIDRALAHWGDPEATVSWHPTPAQLVARDTGTTWWLRFGADDDGTGAIAPGEPGTAAVLVSADADSLHRWLEDHPAVGIGVAGDTSAVRRLRAALGHRLAPARKRSWWRRG